MNERYMCRGQGPLDSTPATSNTEGTPCPRTINQEGNMPTATKAVNEEAVDLIAGTCRERINEMIDDLLKYVDAGDAPGKMTLAITVGPVKDTPGAYVIEVIPSLSVKGMRTDGAATIERVGKELQLKIAGMA